MRKKLQILRALGALMLPICINAQTSYTFTPAGASGSSGPTQAQVNSAYASTNLNGMVTVSAGIQSWTVPSTGAYQVIAYGAEGGFSAGNVPGGMGASISGTFNLTSGQVLKILVGQQPNGSNHGGGGTFVTDNSNNPIIVAGGGGGGCGTGGVDNATTKHGQTTTAGANGAGTGAGIGGVNGNGGGIGASFASGAGGGLLTSGTDGWTTGTGGTAYVLGGSGATSNGQAGFGGGGNGSGIYVGGGGGGYSGGGAATNNGNGNGGVGGGGGSFNSAVNQSNLSGVNSGNGKVVISALCSTEPAPTNTTIAANQNICVNNTTTLSVVGTGTINWYSSPTSTVSLATGPNFITSTLTAGTYTYYAATTNSCAQGPFTAITLTVNPNPSVTATSSSSLICNGQTASLTATGANNYAWNTTATTSIIVVSPTITTNYTVTGVDANNCSASFTIAQAVSPCTGIASNGIYETISIKTYPNPNTGDFIISANSEMSLSLINSLGQVVKVININNSNNYTATISNLTKGIYFVVSNTNNKVVSQKIVVSK